jgi:uncharacterized protein
MILATDILTALTLVLILEGLAYALFAPQIRELMRRALMLPEETLRRFGLLLATLGFITLLLMQAGG